MMPMKKCRKLSVRFNATALLVLFTTLLAVGLARADVVTIAPVQDNTLYDPDCEKSNGAGEFLYSGSTDGQGLRRALLAFDVAGNVPGGVTIESASLSLYMSRSNTVTQTHSLHVLLQAWGEGLSDAGNPGGGGTTAADGDATWCYAVYDQGNPGSSQFWTTNGGDFAATASASQSIAGNGYYTWTSAQMASDVQGWLDAPATNFGWLLRGNEAALQTSKRFDSRERAIVERRPELTIVYGQPSTPPEVTLVAPNGGELLIGNSAASLQWTASDESGVAQLDFYVSLDNGLTFDPVALEVPNTPPLTWFPANRPTGDALIRVIATDNTAVTAADTSDAVFTIQSPPGGIVPTTLRDFDQPGTQPLTGEKLKDPANCATCHADYGQQGVEPYFNWQGSMMAQASIDPLFEACLAIANQDAPDSGDLCLRCHISKAWLAGRSVPTDGNQVLPEDRTGVSCNLCHRLVDPIADPENPPADVAILAALAQVPAVFGTGMYVVDPEASARRGPFVDATSGHPILVSPFHREAAICGTCHNVSNPAFTRDVDGNYVPNPLDEAATDFDAGSIMPVERTYSEWFFSDYNTPAGVYAPQFGGNKDYVATCQDCHMRDVTGKACNNPAAPTRTDLPLHDLTGGSTWLPGLLGALYPGQVNEAALQAGISRARYMLQNAAELSVKRVGCDLVVKVTNNTGHKLPTGYPEGRRMWLNVLFYDEAMTVIGRSGAYNPISGVLIHDPEIKIYEIEPATDGIPGLPDSSLFHFVLNNTVLKDNRIPPRGFTNAAYEAFGGAAVAYSYADGQYWDETTYSIPCDAAYAEVNLLYQSTSKEFIEFLRDENTTNMAGQDLYDLWEDNGKCPPDTMISLFVDFSVVAVGDGNSPSLHTALAQNYPNPFNPTTAIRFAMARKEHARLALYSIDGRLVNLLVDGPVEAGSREVIWDGRNDHGHPMPSGVYFCRLDAGSFSKTIRMMLVK